MAVINRLAYADLACVRHAGIALAAHGKDEALYRAAEYIVIAEPHEARSLRWEFEEGVRNYALNMKHYDECMAVLNKKVSELANES